MDIPRRDRIPSRTGEAVRERYNLDNVITKNDLIVENVVTTADMPFTFAQGGTNVASETDFKNYLYGIYQTGWIPANETWEYASASTITVPTGAASRYQVGDKIKWTQTDVKYGIVKAVTDTLITLIANTDYTVANEAITDVYYSRIECPLGFPQLFNFTTAVSAYTGTISGYTVNHALIGMQGRLLYIATSVTITNNNTGSAILLESIPVTLTKAVVLSGRENSVTGKMLHATTTIADKLAIFNYDGTYAGGNNHQILVSGFVPFI